MILNHRIEQLLSNAERQDLRPQCAPHCCRGMGQRQIACRARPCRGCAPSRPIERPQRQRHAAGARTAVTLDGFANA